MSRKRKFYLQLKEEWKGWLIVNRETQQSVAFSTDFKGAVKIRDFMEQQANLPKA